MATISVAGVIRDHSHKSLRIRRRLGSRSTAEFSLWHEGTSDIERLSSVIVDHGSTRLFRGFAEPREHRRALTSHMTIELTCIDAHYLADKRITSGSFAGDTCGAIVTSLITDILAAEGITAGTIEDGPVLEDVEFEQDRVSDAIQKMADAAGFVWWIDPQLQLHFCARGSVLAPFPINGSTVLADSVKVERTGGQYANRIYIRDTASMVEDVAEQARIALIEGGTGIVERVVDAWHLRDEDTSDAAADSKLTDVAQEEIRLEFQTRNHGLDVGQTITADFPEHRIDELDFTINSLTIHEDVTHSDYPILYTVDASYGPTPQTSAQRLTKLSNRGADISGAVAPLAESAGSVPYTGIQDVPDQRLLGRWAGTTGVAQPVTLHASLNLNGSGVLSVVGGGSFTGDLAGAELTDSTQNVTILADASFPDVDIRPQSGGWLDVQIPDPASAGEVIASFKLDGVNGYVHIATGSNTSGKYAPLVEMRPTDATHGCTIRAEVTDTGAVPCLDLDVRVIGGGFVSNRNEMLRVTNNGLAVLIAGADGNIQADAFLSISGGGPSFLEPTQFQDRIQIDEIAEPSASGVGFAYLYADEDDHRLRVSINAEAYETLAYVSEILELAPLDCYRFGPPYPGGVEFDSDGETGTLTYEWDATNKRTWAKWVSASGTTQNWELKIPIRLVGFNAWTNIKIEYQTDSGSADGSIDISLLGTDGNAATLSGGVALSGSLATETITVSAGTFVDGAWITLTIRFSSKDNVGAYAGRLEVNWT